MPFALMLFSLSVCVCHLLCRLSCGFTFSWLLPNILPSLPLPLVPSSCPPFIQDVSGGILKPTVAPTTNQSAPVSCQQPHKLVSNDLDSSLANLVGSKFASLHYGEE